MSKYEITKHPKFPIILVYLPPFVNWDGLGAKLAADISKSLDESTRPTYLIVDLSASTATLLQIANAVERHTKSDWMHHPNLAGVLVVSQDPAIRQKILNDLSETSTAPIKFFVDRLSALRSAGVTITV